MNYKIFSVTLDAVGSNSQALRFDGSVLLLNVSTIADPNPPYILFARTNGYTTWGISCKEKPSQTFNVEATYLLR